jgi:hypothetical protein
MFKAFVSGFIRLNESQPEHREEGRKNKNTEREEERIRTRDNIHIEETIKRVYQ